MRLHVLSIALLCLMLAVIPASGKVLYENGDYCYGGCIDAWTINMGHVVSDTFTLSANATVGGFDLWLWEFPGDKVLTVDWSITSQENGGAVYGSGTAHVTDTFLYVNEFGY